ncbi:hypothetical protein K469DRAFT_765487 [Zopfia rhizophila CBS 207.26]|uniref:25S rRNA (uridine-N(3))-methyltransferase BMT5-like domain-containing protein n=1 Tax=Zopfia rhizophila CBS 207.26 TaxID=1314779 RepID=A0A6A6D863_9PEZI|nr:hypothetical protein K469DRAFT_765487 [Zopfia rhizophila CBS 207.26]
MSKSKTKKARREAKREQKNKTAAHYRKIAKPSQPSASKPPKPTAQKQKQKQAQKPTIQASKKHDMPFGQYEKILLVGEGDFSFTHSLVQHHGCANVTATSYDSYSDVLSKYPTFPKIHEELSALTPPVPFYHSIDATKLSTYKKLKGEAPYDVVGFMFPHTGGLSTDVNRQVRSNQKLLVEFFLSCLEMDNKTGEVKSRNKLGEEFLRVGGKVIVTLFEGEPYTLWNIRDLARHAGLRVVKSFNFEWGDYLGYAHVRTSGAVEGGGGWRGDERRARMFVFEKAGDGEREGGKGKKRAREESDSEDD